MDYFAGQNTSIKSDSGPVTDYISDDLLGRNAQTNVNLARNLNPDIEASLFKNAEKRNLPVNLLRAADNRDIEEPVSVDDFLKSTKAFLAADVNNAAVARGDESNIDKAVANAELCDTSFDARQKQLRDKISTQGYSPAQVSDLIAAGYEQTDDPTVYRKDNFQVKNPCMDKWIEGPAERDFVEKALQRQKDIQAKLDTYDSARGAERIRNTTPDMADAYIAKLQKENAVMRDMYRINENWPNLPDNEIRNVLDKVNAEQGVDTSDINISRLKESGDIDYKKMVNVFGVSDIMESREGLSDTQLASVGADSPMSDKADLIDKLENESRMLRGSTWKAAVLNSVVSSVPYMAEFAATGGQSLSKEAVKGFIADKGVVKGIAAAISQVFKQEASRLPAFGALIGNDTADDLGPKIVSRVREDGSLFGLDAGKLAEAGTLSEGASQIASSFMNKVLMQYINNASEQAGVFLPAEEIAAKVAKVVPRKLTNAVAVRFLGDFIQNSKGQALVNRVKSHLAFSDIPGEYFEEKVGDAAQALSTGLSSLTGLQFLDMKQDSVFGSFGNETAILASVAAMGAGFQTARLPYLYRDARASMRFIDAQTALKDKVDATATLGRSPAHVENLLSGIMGDANNAYITPENAAVFFQSAPEDASKIGITQDGIAAAEQGGKLIPMSMAQMQTRLSRPAFDSILPKLISNPKNIMTAEDIAKTDIGETAAKAMESDRLAKEETRKAYDNAVSQLIKLGRPASEIRAYAKLLSMSNYFAEHSNGSMTAKDWINNLSYRAMSEPAFLETLNGKTDLANQAAAALRKPGAPNNADKPGKIIDSNVPHTVDFMKDHDMKGKGIFADYEFLHGRHPEYFKSQEEAKAATEFVLDAPEYAGEVAGKHKLFVRKDSESGKIYRIKLKEKLVGGLHQIRSVHELTEKQYEKIKSNIARTLNILPYTDAKAAVMHGRPLSDFIKSISQTNEKVKGDTLEQSNRGAITFNDDFKAVITLFKDSADASTLIHETAHYIHHIMETLVQSGVADKKMSEDFERINKWLDSETDPLKKSEMFARGFERYIMEGKAPSIELKSAFAKLSGLLIQIYKTVSALKIDLSDDVRDVFDGLLQNEEDAKRESIQYMLSEVLNPELLGLSESDKKAYGDLVTQSIEQNFTALQQEKNRQLKELTPEWRREAIDFAKHTRVYHARVSIKEEGGLDYAELVDELGTELAEEFRRKGLTGKKTESGKSLLSFAAAHRYNSVSELLDELYDAPDIRDFVKGYIADRKQDFSKKFDGSKITLGAEANIASLDRLAGFLAEKSGRVGYQIQNAVFKRKASDKLDYMFVKNITNSNQILGDCKQLTADLKNALKSKGYKAAFEISQKLRFNLEILRQTNDAKNFIRKTESLIRRAIRARTGTIEGDFHYAVQDMAYRFGFTTKTPSVSGKHISALLTELSESEIGDASWPDWIKTSSMSYKDLSFEDFQVLSNLSRFLIGTGRDIVKDVKSSRAEKIEQDIKTVIQPFAEMKEKYHGRRETLKDRVTHYWRNFLVCGSKLSRMCKEADGYVNVGSEGKIGPNEALIYRPIADASSDELKLKDAVFGSLAETWKHFSSSLKRVNCMNLPEIPDKVRDRNYSKWTPEMVLSVALNRGNADNLQKLMDGYKWSMSDINNICGRLSAEDWKHVQKVWDALEQHIWPEVSRTFRKLNFFDLKKVEALPFDTRTSDNSTVRINGGYYPISYISDAKEIEDNFKSIKQFRKDTIHSSADFTHSRIASTDKAIELTVNALFGHIENTTHYVTHREMMSRILKMVTDKRYETAFGRTQSFERYDAMLDLLKYNANPIMENKGAIEALSRYGRSCLTVAALGFNPLSALKQLSSAPVGISEVGVDNYAAALMDLARNPYELFGSISVRSAYMKDRWNLLDIDMSSKLKALRDNSIQKSLDKFRDVSFYPVKAMDMAVAIPMWQAMYLKKLDAGCNEIESVKAADEFVSRTQGAGRAVDMSPIQLSSLGRAATVFFSAVSAIQNHWAYNFKAMAKGKLGFKDAALFLSLEFVAPLVIGAGFDWLAAGGLGNEDKARKAFLRSLMSGPLQGVPVVRDVADAATAQAVSGKNIFITPLGFPPFDFYNEVYQKGATAVDAVGKGQTDKAIEMTAEAMGDLFRVPIIKTYKRISKYYLNLTGENNHDSKLL